MALQVTMTTLPARTVYGLWGGATDRTMARDIPALAKRYYGVAGKAPGSVWPFYVITRDYDPQSGVCGLGIAGEAAAEGLTAYTLPAGMYASVAVRPVLGFLWGPAIARAKRDFYTRWLPAAALTALNLEYERHTAGKGSGRPVVTLLFAVRAGGADTG